MSFVEVSDLFDEVRQIDLTGLIDRASRRDGEGCNHLEIARTGEPYPMLSLSLKGDYAVVQYIEDEGSDVQVVKGDASVDGDVIMEFRGPGGTGTEVYNGGVIVRFAVAAEFLKSFVLLEAWPEEPGWLTL